MQQRFFRGKGGIFVLLFVLLVSTGAGCSLRQSSAGEETIGGTGGPNTGVQSKDADKMIEFIDEGKG